MELGGLPAEEHDPDEIDLLVDEELLMRKDDYSQPYRAECPLCHDTWHGLRRGICPGETGIIGSH